MCKKIIAVVLLMAAAMVLYKPAGKNIIKEAVATNVKAIRGSTESTMGSNTTTQAKLAVLQPQATPDLNQKIEYFFNEIPKINSIKHATEHEVHTMPKEVRDAGQYLAEMRDFFVQYPQGARSEMNFYMKCATDTDLFDSVRAICAARTGEKYKEITGRKISPLVFGKRIGDLQKYVKL